MIDSPSDHSASTRIDLPHQIQPIEVVQSIRRRRRRVEATPAIAVESVQAESVGIADAPRFVVEPSDALPEIVVHHADDIALHLAQRLQEVESRELAAQEYETKLQEAEAAARVWVCLRDLELSTLERELQLKSDEVSTQSAAVAAAEIAAEEEQGRQQAVLRQREAELERRTAELAEQEEQLNTQRAALDQAFDKLRAERRRDEELQRSRQQKWQALLEGDRQQAERTLANLRKHRHSLDERERALVAREHMKSTSPLASEHGRRGHLSHHDLEISVLRAEAMRDHRLALEHRWIAGQLWSRLAGSALAGDDELQDSMEQVRRQLETLYRREREALEDLRDALVETAQSLKPAPSPAKAQPRSRKLSFVG